MVGKLNFCNELSFSLYGLLFSASVFYFGATQKSRIYLPLLVNNSGLGGDGETLIDPPSN